MPMDALHASRRVAAVSLLGWTWPHKMSGRTDKIKNLPNLVCSPLMHLLVHFQINKRASCFTSPLLLEGAVAPPSASASANANDFLHHAQNDLSLFFQQKPLSAIGISVLWLLVFPVLVRIIDVYMRVVTPENAYSKLREENESELLDIRNVSEVGERVVGVQVPYGPDDHSFLEAVLKEFKDPANTTLYIMDTYNENSLNVARLLAKNGFKAAYAIKDGFQGWQRIGKIQLSNNDANLSKVPNIEAFTSLAESVHVNDETTEQVAVSSSAGIQVATDLAPQHGVTESMT